MEPIRLSPPPDLVQAPRAGEWATRPALAAATADPVGTLQAALAAGRAAVAAWAIEGPEQGCRLWSEQARLGLAALQARFALDDTEEDRYALGADASSLAQRAWLAGDRQTGRRADLLACELAAGGWPGRGRLDRPDLVLLLDPTGAHALAHAGSRVRLGMIRDFPVAGPEGGGSWRRPGTVDRLLDHVDRQAHLAGPLLVAAARLLRTIVHPAVGPPWPPAAALRAQERLAAFTCRDAGSWAFGLPWLLDTARCAPARLRPVCAR